MSAPERIGAAKRRALQQQLSSRDRAILTSVRDHRYLTTTQLARLHFADHATRTAGVRATVRVLGRLRDLGALGRLARQIGGERAGSAAYVWELTITGERLLAADQPVRGRRAVKRQPSLNLLAHTLAVAETHLQLIELDRAGRLELLAVELEPESWRHYVGPHGVPLVLKPDLAATTAVGDYEDHWFIEIDRGTEGITVLLTKCAQYDIYRQTGREQTSRGVFPLVVWIVPDSRRQARLVAEITTARALDERLYRVIVPQQLTALLTGNPPPGDSGPTPAPTPTNERRNP